MSRKPNPRSKTMSHLNIDRDTELKIISQSKATEKRKSLVPARVNAKTIIFIDRDRDKEKAVADYLRKIEADCNPLPRPKPRTRKK